MRTTFRPTPSRFRSSATRGRHVRGESIEDTDLFSLYGDDAGAPEFTQRHGRGLAVNAEMLGNFFLCPAAHGSVMFFLQKQGGQARDQLPERPVLQVLKHMEKALTAEFKKAIGDHRVLLEESLQIAAKSCECPKASEIEAAREARSNSPKNETALKSARELVAGQGCVGSAEIERFEKRESATAKSRRSSLTWR